MKLVWITTVWPEPRSSAAGTRVMQLARSFREAGWKTVFASACRPNEALRFLREEGWRAENVVMNDSSFDAWIAAERADAVIFDRFMVEEQFGWRVERALPAALRVLDTIDLHFLRASRAPGAEPSAMLGGVPSEEALREIAAIHRSDLAWVVSDFEERLLKERYGVPEEWVRTLRFGPASLPASSPADFSERAGFASIGNFRHPPNPDGLEWFRAQVWPRIRERLPNAVFEAWGAYPPREWMERDDAGSGFRVRGPAPDAIGALSRARVVVAPVRFGAGIKGKVLDGWAAGAPVVATPIAAEGMQGGLPWGGAVASDPEGFALECVRLHEEASLWAQAADRGRAILSALFDPVSIGREAIAQIESARLGLEARRARNLTGALLRYHGARSTEYFSRWIELKAAIRKSVEEQTPR